MRSFRYILFSFILAAPLAMPQDAHAMGIARSIGNTFKRILPGHHTTNYTLKINMVSDQGHTTGIVKGPSGFSCDEGTCQKSWSSGTQIVLVANNTSGNHFVRFSDGTLPCGVEGSGQRLKLDRDRECNAEFEDFYALIQDPPAAATIDQGFDATFSVAPKVGNYTLQWKFNGNIIPGETGTTLTVREVNDSNAGNYSVVVRSGSSSEESAPAVLTVKANEAVDRSQFANQVFAGYQGWFSTPGDGQENRWVHWSGGTPRAGNISFDLYPDVREYDSSDLSPSGLANLGNGQPAMLFSSKREGVVDTHFRWISEYGIDGFAVQRFTVGVHSSGGGDPNLDRIRRYAEKWGKSFYVMYDVSGQSPDQIFGTITGDWQNNIENTLHSTSSPSYARSNGSPVVSIWGMGMPGRSDTPDQLSSLIDWFHARGIFVIGGVSLDWRSYGESHGFMPTFLKLDMIEPWAVGSLGTDEDVAAHYAGYLAPDKQFCEEHGILYRRVIWPGFSWANWNAPPRNGIPRRAGNFFWTQARYASLLKTGAYIAMFDEYDEGTAIAKAAEDASMIPTDQWFLTLDADGRSLSSDFYLRLAGEAVRMIQGQRPRTQAVPISDR